MSSHEDATDVELRVDDRVAGDVLILATKDSTGAPLPIGRWRTSQ
jgi:hypothetical protein